MWGEHAMPCPTHIYHCTEIYAVISCIKLTDAGISCVFEDLGKKCEINT
jgi:hypothetical protein